MLGRFIVNNTIMSTNQVKDTKRPQSSIRKKSARLKSSVPREVPMKKAVRRTQFSGNKSYIITGGLGGLGMYKIKTRITWNGFVSHYVF